MKQIFLPHGKNIPWINIKTGKVVYILSVGENCFVSENVTIGNNVTLMNLITIKGGCTLGIIYPNDQKNQPINFSAKTVIHDGVTVFADSEVSGEITESRIEAYSVIRNGQYKFDGKDKPNSGRVRRRGTRGRRIDSDAHYQTDNR